MNDTLYWLVEKCFIAGYKAARYSARHHGTPRKEDQNIMLAGLMAHLKGADLDGVMAELRRRVEGDPEDG